MARIGSTFRADCGGRLLDSRDRWFCATDLCQAPDGSVIICDFHDQRTAHPDPEASWDRSNGRIYRVAAPGAASVRGLDLGRKTGRELVELLRHPNGWYVEQARALLAARRDRSAWPLLIAMARQTDDASLALQGLWGLYVGGGFNDTAAAELLGHPGEYVRAWVIRLLGDDGKISPTLASRLAEMAAADPSAIVRCQLAASARRLPGADGLPVIERLLRRDLDRDDPYLPLMLWWAVEAKSMTDPGRLLRFFGSREAWEGSSRRAIALRLVRRYSAEGTAAGYEACARLLSTATSAYEDEALAALDLGLAERAASPGGMGMAGLFASVAIPESGPPAPTRHFEPLTKSLVDAVSAAWLAAPTDAQRLRLAIRAGTANAASAALAEAAAPSTAPSRRRVLLGILAELGPPGSVPVALAILEGDHSTEVQSAALDVLARHGDDEAGSGLLDLYPKASLSLRGRMRDVLFARPASPALSWNEWKTRRSRLRRCRSISCGRSHSTATPGSTPWCASIGAASSPGPLKRNWPRSVA